MNRRRVGLHPVTLIVEDDLRRSRLTVCFRLLLAIPHFIWYVLWSIAVLVTVVVGWVIALVTGRLPDGLHRFFCAYIRYSTHLYAYVGLVANPYPGFVGEASSYPIDVALPGAQSQRRVRTLFRIVLAVPAVLVSFALAGGGGFTGQSQSGKSTSAQFSGLSAAVAVLGWFASLVTGRMPPGLRNAGAYAYGYRAQVLAYVLLVTEQYPNADPHALLESVEPPPVHPVHVVGDSEDLRRSRVTVLFRLPLTIPLLVWLFLWSVAAGIAVFLQWFVLLFRGRPATPFHRFVSAWIRYGFHVYAFASLAANPFPGFTGRFGSYPIDLALPAPARQSRWKTLFRAVLVVPAWFVSAALGATAFVSAFLVWFYAIVTGRAPEGLRNVLVYAIRYSAQVSSYLYLLTDVYPHASPLEGGVAEEPDPDHGSGGIVPRGLTAAPFDPPA